MQTQSLFSILQICIAYFNKTILLQLNREVKRQLNYLSYLVTNNNTYLLTQLPLEVVTKHGNIMGPAGLKLGKRHLKTLLMDSMHLESSKLLNY